jgi:hypothetical protein
MKQYYFYSYIYYSIVIELLYANIFFVVILKKNLVLKLFVFHSF